MAHAFNAGKVGRAKEINGQFAVWSWGANSYGQLAQGQADDQLIPREVANVNGQEIQTVTGGGGHTLVITSNGSLQSCGSNNKGQLGLGHLLDVNVLTTLPRFTSGNVVQVAAGWDFTLAVTDLGEVFSFGSNAFGQLGNGSLPLKCPTPNRIEFPDKDQIVQVAAGLRHAAALSENGSVYCWGHSKKGQCGCTSGGNQGVKIVTPTKVTVPEGRGKIITIAAGSYHTLALSDAGEVLLWGCNKYGQTTQNPDAPLLQVNGPYLVPKERFNGRQVKVIRSGWTHVIAQTDTGHLYSWGRSDYGQLGRPLPDVTRFSHIPELIESPENIMDFQCGSEHALFLSDKEKCYAVGWNEHGLCGTGDEENVTKLRLVDSLQDYYVIKIGCGGGHCFAISAGLSAKLENK